MLFTRRYLDSGQGDRTEMSEHLCGRDEEVGKTSNALVLDL